ncbi:MAG: DMT family transporter, partial [Nocardioides sp.]
ALASALSFGLSGALAKGMLGAGWSTGGAVAVRVAVAAAVLLPVTAYMVRGKVRLLRRHAPMIVVYGVVAVAGTQLAFFNAVARMDVGLALLIEYTAPVAVATWLWVRHGHRPNATMVAGAAIAGLGLVLALDLAGAGVDPRGVAWAVAAMCGLASYFVLSARELDDLPPLVLAGAGLLVGIVVLLAAGALGWVPLTMGTDPVVYAAATVPWWVPVLGLGVVTAAFAYITGIEASRRLGARLASFVALTEVLAALGFAWLLLAELPGPVQLVGAGLILLGVVTVKRAERP